MDKTWLYLYDPETKQHSMEWRHNESPLHAPKNYEFKNPLRKFSPRFFVIKTTSSSKGQTINAKYYSSLLVLAIEGHFEGKTPHRGKVTKGVLFLHDNAPAHRALATQKKMAYLGFQCLDHPPYSPDLAPSAYHLFPGLKSN